MTDPKLVELVTRLHRQTVLGKVAWEPTVTDDEFQAEFPDYTIRISIPTLYSYRLEILNPDGRVVEAISSWALEKSMDDAVETMSELYAVARRTAMRVDEALDDLLSKLGDED